MRQEWLDTDYYAILGVSKSASEKEIKKAYRKLAQQYHPDKNPGDDAAELKFKEANEAYEVVGDGETRKEYDHAREMGYFVGGPSGGQQYVRVEDLFGGGGGQQGEAPFDLFGGLGDLFGQRGQARQQPRSQAGQDLSTEMSLSFHEALAGVTRQLNLDGQRIKVKIPQGINDGTRIKVAGKGAPGFNGGPNGDLFVRVHVGSHPVFGRSGNNLTITVPVSFTEAALGSTIDVPTLDGKVRLRIPPGTQSGKRFRVRDKGVATSKATGDMLVTVEVVVPETLTDEQRTLLEDFRDQAPDANPRAHLGV